MKKNTIFEKDQVVERKSIKSFGEKNSASIAKEIITPKKEL